MACYLYNQYNFTLLENLIKQLFTGRARQTQTHDNPCTTTMGNESVIIHTQLWDFVGMKLCGKDTLYINAHVIITFLVPILVSPYQLSPTDQHVHTPNLARAYIIV